MRLCAFVLSFATLAAGLPATTPGLDAQGRTRAHVQLAPHCNVLTFTVGEDGRGLAAAGSDDRCGLGASTPVSGRAFRNGDGTLRIALYVHDGREVQLVWVHLDATGRGGTWHDTAGRAGVAQTPGATAPRRPSRGGLPGWASNHAGPATAGSGQADVVRANLPSGFASSFFFPRDLCTYGRQFLRMHEGAILCEDVITPVPFDASDMALGSDGNPALVGPGVGGAGVVVTHCGNPACSGGNTTAPLSTTASRGRIATGLDGLPVVAMVEAGTVVVTKCGDLGCTSGIQSTVSTSALNFSLVIGSDGLPLVVGSSPGFVRVIHCGDPACTSANTTVDVPLQNATAVEPQVAIAPNGLPVVAFRYEVPFPQVEDGVRLHFCADLACSSGSTSGPVMVNTSSQNNRFCCGLSLAIGIDGLVVVTSHRMHDGLWAAHCDDAACSSSSSSSKNADAWLPGVNVDVLIGAHGVPVMSHFGANDLTLRVTECRDVACTGFAHPTRTVDVNSIHRANVLGSEGLPIVAYSGSGGGRVVACGTKGCQVPPLSRLLEPLPLSVPAPGR